VVRHSRIVHRHQQTFSLTIPPNLTLLDETRLVEMGIAGSVHTLRDWRKRGKGPRFIKVGSSVRYRLSDIEDFVNSLPAGGGGKMAAELT
jgi:hypothetical protein